MANFITIFRIFLVFLAIPLLYIYSNWAYLAALILIIIAFILDGVDGWVARKFNESSKLGAVLDIMSDRIVENVLWIITAVLGWLPVAFPIIVIVRSFVVDSLRSVASEQGYTAFGEKSMQSDKVGYFITSSKFMRVSYAVAKVIAFILLIIAQMPFFSNTEFGLILYVIGILAAFLAVEFCVLRGLPVVFESKKLFK